MPDNSPTARIAVCLAIVLAGACTPEPPQEQPVEIRDSAGIRVVENRTPLWPADGGWTVDPDPVMEIGGGAEGGDRFLYRVETAYQVIGSREIVVANRGSTEVLVYDSAGSFVRAIGGQGEGPGELMNLFGLHPCGSGRRFLVSEGARASLFGLEGEVIQIISQWRRDFPGGPMGLSSDCSSVLFKIDQEPPEVVQGARISFAGTLYWGDLETRGRRLLSDYTVREAIGGIIYDRPAWSMFPWSRHTLHAVFDDRVYLATGERFEVQLVEEGQGLVEVIRWDGEPPLVTPADRRMASSVREREVARNPALANLFPELGDTYVPERKPTSFDVVVDDDGNLWVQEYPEWLGGGLGNPEEDTWGADPVGWTVLDSSGRWLGTVEIPAELEVYGIQNGHILGKWRDELGVEYVRLYRIRGRD